VILVGELNDNCFSYSRMLAQCLFNPGNGRNAGSFDRTCGI
jgi:hypothetical protein